MFVSKLYNKVLRLSLVTLAIGVATSCSDETTQVRGGIGLIQPVVTVNPAVTVTGGGQRTDILISVPSPEEFSLSVSSASGQYGHVWEKMIDYDPNMPYEAGEYIVEAFYGNSVSEGIDNPWFKASQTVHLEASATERPELECRLASTLFRVEYSEAFRSMFESFEATMHSAGGSYMDYPPDTDRPLFMHAGKLTLDMTVTLASGQTVSFEAATVGNALPAHLYHLRVDASERPSDGVPVITLSFDETILTDDITIALTPEFIASAAPVVTAKGLGQDGRVTVVEGAGPSEPIIIEADASSMSSLMLTTNSAYLIREGWPDEVDLLHLTAEQSALMQRYGLKMERQYGGLFRVNLTEVVPNLLSAGSDASINTFTFLGVGANRKLSERVTASVTVLPAEVAITEMPAAIVGVDEAEFTFSSPVDPQGNFKVYLSGVPVRNWEEATVLDVKPAGAPGIYTVRYIIPEGDSPLTVRLDYCGVEKARAVQQRAMPQFGISVNAYALKAIIDINAENPDMVPLITSIARIYAGDKPLQIIERDTDKGIIVVGGLQAGSRYAFRATMFSQPVSESDFTASVQAETEKCRSLENGSFDDVSGGIKYKDLNSGGTYSQSIVPIYNGQNRVAYDLQLPKGWADTNAKTFCMNASNHNTWYMQPTTYIDPEGYMGNSLKLQSSAWDVFGEEIKPYLQESRPFVRYSRNVPEIAYKAAGKAFLGRYSFDASTLTETYEQGIPFDARPSALNGFYRYMPCTLQPADRGLVTIEVMGIVNGEEVPIGSGRGELIAASGFTAFSVPVEYTHPYVKATSLRVMLASTVNIGTISHETSTIVTVPDMPSATSLGSALWLDELSLSY